MAELFGFSITRSKEKASASQNFTLPSIDDGAQTVVGGGIMGHYLDMEGKVRDEADLIRRYREVAMQPECDMAVEDVVNEAIVSDDNDPTVRLNLDQLNTNDSIKEKIHKEFDNVLRLLQFNEKGHDIFRRWYVDGRIYYHKIINTKNIKDGIVEVRYIDPRKIKKMRELITKKTNGNYMPPVGGKPEEVEYKDYFIYNEKGVGGSASEGGMKISPDAIAFCPSGIIDQQKNLVLSYLHKAIKPVNQLRMIEDSLVIYRISRAPERRIFYIDVGNLPKVKAEQYLKDVMQRYRNKLVYDAKTGEIRDDRNHMSMLEDFWLPRREGGRGTEISTLPGGQNLGEIDDIIYFQRKLYRSLNVPISRLEAEQNFSLGRTTEITRDELKFSKFVQRIRKNFTPLFNDILKSQLVLKNVINIEEWNDIKEHIQYDFMKDGHFAELKDAEILREQLDQLGQVEGYIGTFFSKSWVQKNILKMTDYEIEEMRKQINIEAGNPPDEGGVNIGDNDGITNEPLKTQQEPEEPQGDNNEQ